MDQSVGNWIGRAVAISILLAVMALLPAPVAAPKPEPLSPAPTATETNSSPLVLAPEDAPLASTTAATTTTQATDASEQPVAVVPSEAVVLPATPTPTTPAKEPEAVNVAARAALVNILCTTKAGGSFNPISGSGVIIDSRGIILTNAHVAQYFLLRDYLVPGNIECVIRIGSPAQPRYHAELLYLPPAWVAANASQITAQQATGTGEHDYAFLRITGTTNPSGTLPATFPRLDMRAALPGLGEPMLLAAYPAGFLSGELISTNLYASSAFTHVTQLLYFNDASSIDLFSIGGTVVTQSGSSGGAAVRTHDASLAGIIVTATVGQSTATRDLRALTLAYIERSLAQSGKGGITTMLSGDLAAKAADFNTNTAPGLRAQLEAALNKK